MAIDALQLVLSRFGAAESEGGVAALGINLPALLFQLVTFAIVFFILKKYALGPIVNTLEQRRQTINESLKNAEEIEKKTEQLDRKFEQRLAEARTKADKIIAQANEQAGELAKAAEDRATTKTEQMVKDAHNRIAADVDKAKHDLKSETLDLVASATEAILREKIDRQRDAQLLAKSLGDVKEQS